MEDALRDISSRNGCSIVRNEGNGRRNARSNRKKKVAAIRKKGVAKVGACAPRVLEEFQQLRETVQGCRNWMMQVVKKESAKTGQKEDAGDKRIARGGKKIGRNEETYTAR